MHRFLMTIGQVAITGLCLAACSGSDAPPLADYLQRLGRSLDRDIETAAAELPAFPGSRELRIELQSGAIDLLDMLALSGCQLAVTIGRSNSSLGKMASSSQRLLLELEFLARAPACIAALDPTEHAGIRASLRTAMETKQRQLPARIWNATLAGPEFRAFWQRPRSLANYPLATGGAVPTALARLEQLVTAWLAGDYAAGQDELEDLLAMVRRGDGGALLAALDLQQRGLAAAAPAIDERLHMQPLCFNNRPSPEGDILDTVVRKYFAGAVQAWSVRLEQRRQLLLPAVYALEQKLQVVSPTAYRDWQGLREERLQAGAAAPRHHALALAELLDSCGLRPGASVARTP